MTTQRSNRRTVLKALGGGVAGLLAAGQASAATSFEDELDAVRTATEKYWDPRAAVADGFQPGGPYVPGMGWHWINPDRVQRAAEGGLNLEAPQILVYADTDPGSPDGHLVLGAAEWGIPVGAHGYAEENPPDLFSDEDAGAEEHWHVHHSRRHVYASGDGQPTDPATLSVAQLLQRGRWAEIPPDRDVRSGEAVTADWGLTGTEETRTVDLATEPHPDLLTLHAWVHLPNRNHALNPTNANLTYVQMLPSELMPDWTAKPD